MYRFLIIVLCCFFSQNSFAQDPTLFEVTWVLESLTIDGEEFLPPSNAEVAAVELIFVEANNGDSDTAVGCVCDCFSGSVAFDESTDSPSTFMIGDDYVTTLANCNESENEIFQNRYFTFHEASLTDPFEYVTTYGDNEDEISLEVISSTGDIALYNNATLAVSDTKVTTFSIYPNPAQEQLYIDSDRYTGGYTITVFDIQGKQLMSTSKDILGIHPIAIQDWRAGIYLIKIEDVSGAVTTKRFIKK